jgi:biotin/lipoyl-binding protein/coenzyme PQQ synthesis protein D (PqqD)
MEIRGPEVDPHLTIVERDGHHLAMSRTGVTLRLNELQVEVLCCCDGRTSIDEIANACSERFEQEIPTEAVEGFLEEARKMGLLSLRYAGPVNGTLAAKRCRHIARRLRTRGLPPPSTDHAIVALRTRVIERLRDRDYRAALEAAYTLETVTSTAPWARVVVREVERLGDSPVLGDTSPLFLTLPLVNPMRWLKQLDRWIGWAFGWTGLLVWLVFVLGGLWLTLDLDLLAAPMRRSSAAVATLYIAWTVSIIVHELSHALTCVHFGGPVERMGLGLMWGVVPFAFADVTSSYLIAKKHQRLLVILAGTMGSLVFMAGAMYLCAVLPTEQPVRHGLIWFILASATANLIFNLAPFIKLDGYYFLCDAVDLPNLWHRSFDFAGRCVGRLVVGESVTLPRVTGRERWILLGYASLSLVYAAVLVVYSLAVLFQYLVPQWRGYGLALIGAGVALFFGPSGVRLCLKGWRFMRQHKRAFISARALALVATPLGAVALVLALVRLPESAAARFVIVPSVRVDVSPRVSGKVVAMLVRGGERVRTGQVLAVLDNPEVTRRRAVTQAKLTRARALLELCMRGARTEEKEAAAERARASAARAGLAALIEKNHRTLFQRGFLSAAEAEDAHGKALTLAAARREAEATKDLLEAGCRVEDIEASRAQVDVAAAVLAAADKDAAALVIRSPIGGWIVDSFPEERIDHWVLPGKALLTLFGKGGLIAELVPDWMFSQTGATSLKVKLVLADGRAVYTTIRRPLPRSETEPGLRFETETLEGVNLYAGLTGPAKIYGPAVPLAIEYIWHPLKRLMVQVFWTAL